MAAPPPPDVTWGISPLIHTLPRGNPSTQRKRKKSFLFPDLWERTVRGFFFFFASLLLCQFGFRASHMHGRKGRREGRKEGDSLIKRNLLYCTYLCNFQHKTYGCGVKMKQRNDAEKTAPLFRKKSRYMYICKKGVWNWPPQNGLSLLSFLSLVNRRDSFQ